MVYFTIASSCQIQVCNVFSCSSRRLEYHLRVTDSFSVPLCSVVTSSWFSSCLFNSPAKASDYSFHSIQCTNQSTRHQQYLQRESTDYVLRVTMCVDKDQLNSQFQRMFGLKLIDSFRRSLTLQYYQGVLFVRDKFYRHESTVNRSCSRCAQSDETVCTPMSTA